MRVMQLIDSLDIGGAERMAVTYANSLTQVIDGSYLCATRAEGPLHSHISGEVSYLFLGRKKRLDRTALKKCLTYIKTEQIDIIHVHGTSYFFATLIKLQLPSIKIVWHNHHGASLSYKGIKLRLLQWCSRFFSAVCTVNMELEAWALKKLNCKRVIYIQNFLSFPAGRTDGRESGPSNIQQLEGIPGHRVISLANLRHPKEHFFLCKAFKEVLEIVPTATLHLVGTDYEDEYSQVIKKLIKEEELEQHIFIHGRQDKPQNYLDACAIGLIASSSEGLPMALLEYGRSGLGVITTDVGECAQVVSDNGYVIPSQDIDALKDALVEMLKNTEKRDTLAKEFQKHIRLNYSETQVLDKIQLLYKQL